MPGFMRMARVICHNDLRVLARRPAKIAAAVIPALIFLFIELLEAAAVTSQPIALVTLNHSQKALQMQQIFHESDVFRITDATPQEAQRLYNAVQVAAVVTIPADFDARIARQQPSPVDVELNNLNTDSADDIRRGVPDVITQFYALLGARSPVAITMREHNLRDADIEIFQYEVLPTLLLILLICGLVNTAVTSAAEWQSRRIKEVLLAPVSASAITVGKVSAGFLVGCFAGILELAIAYAMAWIRPVGFLYWLSTLLIVALVALLAASLGILLGNAMRKIQATHTVAVSACLYLFFLAGGLGVFAFEPDWLQQIGFFLPLTYANHALQMSVLYHSFEQLGRDAAVLALTSLLALGGGILALQRK